MKIGFLIPLYLLSVIGLFFYSYTQVDLNLTISQINIFQTVQQVFQEIGYFQRPFSTAWYVSLIGMLFVCYGGIIYLVKRGHLSVKGFWVLVALTVGILVFSYPAFSYDVFNYLFAAKEIIVYHKNPYAVTPQQFIGVDPWVLFMRWIHLPSAYSPLWIGLTLPFYLFGFGIFLPTLFSFKLIAALSYLVTIWAIGKILEVVEKPRQLLGMALFAFNPLVLVEALVSAHNDSVMMAIAACAVYLFVQKRFLAGFFVLALSAGLKTVTAILMPVWAWASYTKTTNWRFWYLIAMTGALLLVAIRREFLQWYLLWIIPFVALLPDKRGLTAFSTVISLGLLLRYAPFLYFGNWDQPVPLVNAWILMISIVIGIVVFWIDRVSTWWSPRV